MYPFTISTPTFQVSAAIKDKERLERLSTVRAAEKGMKEELQEKIQIKQEEAAKRYEENT